MPSGSRPSATACLVLVAAVIVAAASARRQAGGWNDGSRLATVESLVDHRTLAIDRSIFVAPPGNDPTARRPYALDEPALNRHGTGDKVLVGGHFYSDKPPVPALLMAALYGGLQWTTGLTARTRPDRFCYWMTLGSSGVAYVVAVWCIFLLAGALRLRSAPRVALTASFGLATLAPTYARSVNGHILLLAVAAALLLGLVALADERRAGSFAGGHPLALGTLAGLGYSIDLGAGALLLVCALAVTAHRCRHIRAMTLFVLGALPWLALHHALNYAIGGTFGPVATVPEYFQWPGSTFTLQNLTGT